MMNGDFKLKYVKIIPVGIIVITIIVLGYNFTSESDIENEVEEQFHDEKIEFILQNLLLEQITETIIEDEDGTQIVLIEGMIENEKGEKIKIGLHTMVNEDGDEKIKFVETNYGKIFKILTIKEKFQPCYK